MTVDMINPKNMYTTTDVISRAMNASWLRNEVINNNIANVDTPGYKRNDVAFEEYLRDAIGTGGKTNSHNIKKIQPKIIRDNNSLSYRLDGNNVDIDTEMSYLAINQLRYDTLTAQVNYNFSRLKSVMR